MAETTYRGRRAVTIENDELRVTVVRSGGHIAEITDKATGVNPLWTPKWGPDADFGTGSDARLLAGIMGHNLCLDLFGGPSDDEFRAGVTAHGEGSVVDYDLTVEDGALVQRAEMPLAQIRFERRITLHKHRVGVHETVESLAAFDRPIGWTQHVTLGEPFVERGVTRFEASATKSKVFDGEFGKDDYLRAGAEFDWPMAPLANGGTTDLRVLHEAAKSSAFTAHLMNPAHNPATFLALSRRLGMIFSYSWDRRDFPWLGIWEENHSRTHAPWNGQELTRGMEFGVSPIPESRREMVKRGLMFGENTYRWLPARGRLEAEYIAFLMPLGDELPERLLQGASEIQAVDILPIDR